MIHNQKRYQRVYPFHRLNQRLQPMIIILKIIIKTITHSDLKMTPHPVKTP